MQLVTHISFADNCREAFTFYEKALGGQIVAMVTYDQTPMKNDETWKGLVMHARLVVGNAVLMGSDSPPEYRTKAGGFDVAIQAASVEEAEQLYAALSEGGEIRMPLQETFWAHRFAMFTDKFGTPWFINFEKPMEQ